MAGLYLDTSALGRVLLAEPDAAAIRATLVRYDGWWSSGLLIVELRRLAAREGLQAIAEGMLRGVRTVPVDGAALDRSSRLCCHSRSGRSMRSTSTPLGSSTAPVRWPPC